MKRLFYLLILLVGLCLGIFFLQHPKSPQSSPSQITDTNSETPSTPAEPSATPTPTPSEQTESTPDQKTDVRTPPPSPTPVQPSKPQSKKLVIYLEKSLIPKTWLEEWNKSITVEQHLLTPGQEAPTDGDLYAISPRVFNELRGKIDFAKYESSAGLEGVNPAFLGQGFDLDNEWTRPWRWTPYFIYYRNTTAKATALPANWLKSPSALFSSDIDWIVALKMKEDGRSANLIKSSNWGQILETVEKDVNGHTATEEECWQALRDGKAQISFLPAAMRLRPPIEDPANLSWFAPTKNNATQFGTLAQFDLLVIPRNSQAPDAALSLVKFLLQPAQQEKLTPETGYFAVKCETGKETKAATIPTPAGTWLSSTEFLLKPSVETIAKAVPVSKGAEVAPSKTP